MVKIRLRFSARFWLGYFSLEQGVPVFLPTRSAIRFHKSAQTFHKPPIDPPAADSVATLPSHTARPLGRRRKHLFGTCLVHSQCTSCLESDSSCRKLKFGRRRTRCCWRHIGRRYG